MANDALGGLLLALAREAIVCCFRDIPAVAGDDPRLATPGATFVTLTQGGRLRGCIGSLDAWRPLADDVRENAYAAAFSDPRFPPLAATEVHATHVEVSLLTPPEPIAFVDEADALRQLQPGVDGIVLECDGRRATFLPQVWEQLPEPERFLGQLKRKAGLPADYWNDALRLSRYRVDKWKEA
ncbi:MAG: AmmeMemoRadiSam system protein A [Rhodocyclales bacterium]|nr:AmmeMemoRadiSam system protein A [Rhodocyclales bacterium]